MFPDWLFLLDGVRQLLERLHSTNNCGLLSPILAQGVRRWSLSHLPQHTNSNLLNDLESLVVSTVHDAAHLQTYRDAIRELRCHVSLALSADHSSPDIMDAFVWQYEVVGGFLPLLRVPTQEAVAIFVHFCIVLSRLEGQRWLQGWATFLVSRAWEMLDEEHRMWIQWPIEEIGWVRP